MTLNEWQAKLEEHFATLQRQPDRSTHPIFALEHGLDTSEREDLSQAVRFHIAQTGPSERHWLVWVVYATEVGYDFSGDEYWQTFADRTPGWLVHGDRGWIRDAFRKFHRVFSGAKPYGRWAEHFSIICWPITHAIIPKDLQRQLAEVLYDIRVYFDTDLLNSPQMLGERVAAYSWRASSRFQNLAEQHLLVGQIASSLLLNEDEESSGLILSATRRRIAADLDVERRAREWLSDAREHATAVRLQGLRKGSKWEDEVDEETDDRQTDGDENSTRKELRELGIEPKIILRPAGNQVWDVRLQIPNLSALLSRFPGFKGILAGQRCSVAGAWDPRPLARGRVLFAKQEVSLGQWPQVGQVLLKFDDSCPELDFLLHTECLLRPGPTWVFRIASDGSAVEHLTKTLRPASDYIVLSTDLADGTEVDANPVALTCAGVHAIRIAVPDKLSQSYSDRIGKLGLTAARAIRVWPAGLIPVEWDDEGRAEWLTTDRPCIGIATDFPVTGLILNLLGPRPSRIAISPSEIENPLFICLGELPEGHQTLHVIAASQPRPTIGTLSVRIRPPRTQRNLTGFNSPLQVVVTPGNSTMEQLWDGSTGVEILGPESHNVGFELVFYRDRNCSTFLAERRFGPIQLPVSASQFSDAFQTAIANIQNTYDDASACLLHVRTEELGQQTIHFEREFVPLRWVLRHENQRYHLRIVQLDEERPVKISHYLFDHPDQFVALPGAEFLRDFRVPENGGLYVGTSDGHQCSIVVPPKIHSLTDLGLKNERIQRQHTENDLAQLFAAFDVWSRSRLPGDLLAKIRKQKVLERIKNGIVAMLCGGEWAAVELTLGESSKLAEALREKIPSNSRLRLLLSSLITKSDEFTRLSTTGTAELLSRTMRRYVELPVVSLAQNYGVSSHQWMAEFALRTFSTQENLRQWAAQEFCTALNYLLQNPLLARAARFITLLQQATEKEGA